MNGVDLYSKGIEALYYADQHLTDIYVNDYKAPENVEQISAFCSEATKVYKLFDEYEDDINSCLINPDAEDLAASDVVFNMSGALKESVDLLENYVEPQTDGEKMNIDTITQDVRDSYGDALKCQNEHEAQLCDLTIKSPDEARLEQVINKLYDNPDYTKQNLSYDIHNSKITFPLPECPKCYEMCSNEDFGDRYTFVTNSLSDLREEINSYEINQLAFTLHNDIILNENEVYTENDAKADAEIIVNAIHKFSDALDKAEQALDKESKKDNRNIERED